MPAIRNVCLGLVVAHVAAMPAVAQDSAAVLDEVVVTAQRRVENLQQVPVAATALNAAELQSKAIARLGDLQSAAPSLSITDAGQTQSVNIRGIGLASNSPNATAGVATYVDGLFQPPIVQANSFFDLSSIEVFRGPQGTLVGTNSTGGAIFVNSASPELGATAGHAEAGLGNFQGREAQSALNLPASETLALRVAGLYRAHDSYYDDIGPFHNDAGKLDEKGGRLGVLWKPGSFSALAKVQSNDMQTGGFAFRPVPGTTYSAFRVGDLRTLSYDAPTSHREKATLASLELRQELSNGVILRSLSGYQYKRIFSFDDLDGSQAPPAAGGQSTWDYFAGEKQYSEEINIISPTAGAFDWILGGYFQRNDIDVEIHQLDAGFPTDILPENRRTTTGFFAQTSYALNDAFELQVGARYSTYDVDADGVVLIGNGIPGFPVGGSPVTSLAGRHEDQRTTGKIALNWTPDESNLLYVFAARGYKPGGANSRTSEFDPETVLNYEAGWKSTFLYNRMRTQVAVFYNDYSDFQFDVLEPQTGQGGVRNVASATIKGFELQLEGRLGGFGFDGGAAYVDSQLAGLTFVNTRRIPPGNLGPQCPVGVPTSPPFCFDYAPFVQSTDGGPNLYSPKWTYNMGADYTFAVGNGLTLTPRANYSYVGSRFTYIAYAPVSDRIDGFGLLSALVTLRADRWFVEAYGTNLTDKDYISGQASASSNEFYGPPRQYGLRVGVDF